MVSLGLLRFQPVVQESDEVEEDFDEDRQLLSLLTAHDEESDWKWVGLMY